MTSARYTLEKLSAAILTVLVGIGSSAEPRTTIDAVYSKQQARGGEQLYKKHCLVCHDKKYFQPVLEVWSGQSVGTLLQMMSATMPESDPGGLRDREYVDILAYIFSLSKLPAGEEPLENRGTALDEMVIATP